MKTDEYTSNMNGTTVFVKGYRASVRMQVETPNTPVPPVPPANYSEPQSHELLVMNSCNEKRLFLWPKPITRLFTTTDSWNKGL